MSFEKHEKEHVPIDAIGQSMSVEKRAAASQQEQDVLSTRVLALKDAMARHVVKIQKLCADMESVYREAQQPGARSKEFMWHHMQETYAEMLAEYNVMQHDYTGMQQGKIDEPLVAHTAKALLEPALFDNYKLWRLFYKHRVQWEQVTSILDDTDFSVQSSLHFYFWPGVLIFSPPLNIFLLEIKRRCTDSFKIIDIIIESCIDPKEQQQLRFYYQYTSLLHQLFGNNDVVVAPAPVDGDSPVSPHNACDQPLQDLGGHYIGQPKHQFNIQNMNNDISMQLWGLLIAAVGISAIAVAFTVLNAATFGLPGVVVAGIGLATTLVGFGLFKSVYDSTNASYAAIDLYPNIP